MLKSDFAKKQPIPHTIKTLIVMQESVGWGDSSTSYLIGTAAVSAYVKQMGHNIICLNLNSCDCMGGHVGAGKVYGFVRKHSPDVVMVGGLVTDWKRVKEVCDMARVANPDIIVVIGGGFVTYSPEEAMRLIDVADYGIIGEGELTAHELLLALENGEATENIPGLIYRDSVCGFIITQKRDDIHDIDTLPFLDYDGFGLFDEIRRTKSMAINSSRSCPFNCTYCTQSGGWRYRQRSLNHVFGEIDYVLSHVPEVKKLTIYDELFSSNKERFEQFIERIAPYNFNWFLSMRADSFNDPNIFKKAYAAGCKRMQIGLESGCDAILKSMRKGTSKAMLRELYKNANESNISIVSNLIFGDAAETMETVEESFAFASEIFDINPHTFIGVAPIKLYPGSVLYNDAKNSKKIEDTTQFIADMIPLVNLSKMKDEEYNFLVKRIAPAMSIWHRVRHIVGHQPDEKKYTYLNIADMDRKEKTYRLSYICPKCNKTQHIIASKLTYGLSFEDVSYCPACHAKIHKALLLDDGYFQLIKPTFKNLLEIGNAGVSGMGSFFARYRLEFKTLFDELEIASKSKFVLSDGSFDIAAKSVVIGRKIYNTENILDKVKNIVVPSIVYPQIKEDVNSREPKINVFDFFELPFID